MNEEIEKLKKEPKDNFGKFKSMRSVDKTEQLIANLLLD